MKKTPILIALILVVAATGMAAAPHRERNLQLAERQITASIRSQIQFPEYLRESEGEHAATITFRVNPCGTIAIQEIQSDEDDLRQAIASQVQNMHVEGGCPDSRDTYKVVVRFKIL